MASFQVSGRILHIGNTESIPYQDKVFRKRELVLDCSYRNQFTGEVERPNYPCFEFTGNGVDDLSGYNAGDIVTVSFVLNGRRIEKDGQVKYFTNVQGYRIERYQTRRTSLQQTGSNPQQGYTNTVQAAAQAAMANAAGAPQFPPTVNADGQPVEQGGKDDLPF